MPTSSAVDLSVEQKAHYGVLCPDELEWKYVKGAPSPLTLAPTYSEHYCSNSGKQHAEERAELARHKSDGQLHVSCPYLVDVAVDAVFPTFH